MELKALSDDKVILMKNLILLRHAKSCWDTPSLTDFDRPLNKRGFDARSKIAKFIFEHLPHPDLILCSAATRTQQTFESFAGLYTHPFELDVTERLYHASSRQIIDHIKTVKAETILIIGHNPGLQDCALHLCDPKANPDYQDMSYKFPTAACAYITFAMDNWSDLTSNNGKLREFVKARNL